MPLRMTRRLWRGLGVFEANVRCLDASRVVLWGHLGLGDQISTFSAVQTWAARGHEVILPCKSKNAEMLSSIYGGLSGVRLHALGADDSRSEREQICQLSRNTRSVTMEAGHALLPLLLWLFPEMGLNGVLALAAFSDPSQLQSPELRRRISLLPQIDPPAEEFAFVDHHPGTSREVPQLVLRSIQERGLLTVPNPRDVTMWSTLGLLDSAAEIHLVSSAPLCLALAANARSPLRIRYREAGARGLMRDYDSTWLEVALGPPPTLVDRDSEWRLASSDMSTLRSHFRSKFLRASEATSRVSAIRR